FFERWCQSVIADSADWQLMATNYPVEFPRANGPLHGQQSALDIRAQRRAGNDLFTLVIECKKNNPEFVRWVFFEKRDGGSAGQPLRLIVNDPTNRVDANQPVTWTSSAAINTFRPVLPVADEGREARGSYVGAKQGNLTKTSNAAIQDAAWQVS